MSIFIENLNLATLVHLLLYKKADHVYVLDPFKSSKLIIKFLNLIFNLKFEIAKFNLLDIVDENRELARFKIDRIELFKIQDKIESSHYFRNLKDVAKTKFLKNYLFRDLIGGQYNIEEERVNYTSYLFDRSSKKDFKKKK